MNKKLIFRILGAVASALIIVSVFVPFISITGYSTSLWSTNNLAHTLYLPIMIIVFGAIGVMFFALNIKTEFAYATSGATLFFIVMQTISIINQNNFNTLSIGYYFLCVGSIMTGLMAFLCNLKPKYNVALQPVELVSEEPTVLNQIDKLYNNDTNQDAINTIQVDNNIQPIPVAPLEQDNNKPISEITPIIKDTNNNSNIESTNNQPIEESNVVVTSVNDNSFNQINNVEESLIQQSKLENPMTSIKSVKSNSVLEQFNTPSVQQPVQPNPVLEQFNTPPVEQPVQPNPVSQGFNIAPEESKPLEIQQEFSVPLSSINEPPKENPVLEQFNNTQTNNSIFNTSNTQGDTDIFGQPVNK